MKNFRELKIWEKAHALTLKIYKLTNAFPKEEQYGLISQLRRACSSIPTNIAEGCGRGRDTELKRFSEIAMGSAMEVDYLLQLSNDLNFLKQTDYEALLQDVIEVKKMLTSFIQKLKADC